MIIYRYLDEVQDELLHQSWDEIEKKYYSLCSQLAGESQAKRIKNINLKTFESKLQEGLAVSLRVAHEVSAKAIYFEYDLDNEWNSAFFICDEYSELSYEDDEWASDWIEEIAGPNLEEFSSIYAETGFDGTDKAVGTTVYLIIRTVIAFRKVVESIQCTIPICIGFHDQDPIMRIQE